MKIKFPRISPDFGAGCIAVFVVTTLAAMFFGALSLSATGGVATGTMVAGLVMCVMAAVSLIAGVVALVTVEMGST